MNKNLFQPGEIKTKEGEFKLGLVHTFEEPVEEVEVEEVPQYTGPTADDLKREAEDFKVQWESEKQKMLDDAQAQANAIIESAKNAAFEEVKNNCGCKRAGQPDSGKIGNRKRRNKAEFL